MSICSLILGCIKKERLGRRSAENPQDFLESSDEDEAGNQSEAVDGQNEAGNAENVSVQTSDLWNLCSLTHPVK